MKETFDFSDSSEEDETYDSDNDSVSTDDMDLGNNEPPKWCRKLDGECSSIDDWIEIFNECYSKNSQQDAWRLGYPLLFFHKIFPNICSCYVKNCRNNWKFLNKKVKQCTEIDCEYSENWEDINQCSRFLSIVFFGIKQDTCDVNPTVSGHRNALFILHSKKKYFWFDPEGSNKRTIDIIPLLKYFNCEDYKEIVMDYGIIQKEPSNDRGYCATWCYLFAFLIVTSKMTKNNLNLDKVVINKKIVDDIVKKICGKMKTMKGFASFTKYLKR